MHAKGTHGKFRGFKCIVLLYDDGTPLLEFESLPSTSEFGWYGLTRPDIYAADPYKSYWWDHKAEFVPDPPVELAAVPWALKVDKITRATYRKIPCKVLPNRGLSTVIEFDSQPEGFSTFKGTQKEPEDPKGILSDKYYRYVKDGDQHLIIDRTTHGYNCCECHGRTDLAEANLTDNRFICWSCAASYRWKHEGHFLPGHRFYTKPAT